MLMDTTELVFRSEVFVFCPKPCASNDLVVSSVTKILMILRHLLVIKMPSKFINDSFVYTKQKKIVCVWTKSMSRKQSKLSLIQKNSWKNNGERNYFKNTYVHTYKL